jgi:hypothetical protein
MGVAATRAGGFVRALSRAARPPPRGVANASAARSKIGSCCIIPTEGLHTRG